MNRALGFSALALAIGLAAAPRAQAQSSGQLFVCRDGEVTSTRYGARACDRHGGIDQQATGRVRQRGVYGNGGTNGNRAIYNGSSGGSVNRQRGIYPGGIVIGTNRQVYGGIINRDEQEHHDNGKHLGWYKNHKHQKGDRDHDRDDRDS